MESETIKKFFDLSKKQDIAWQVLEEDPVATEVFFGGAAGPGKTTLGCIWQMTRRIIYPGTKGLIGRDQFSDLRDTTLATFLWCWSEYGQHNIPGVTGSFNAQDKIFRFSNGSEILFRHLAFEPSDPDFHRLGSLEVTDAFVDELPEVHEKAWDIVTSRIRHRLDLLPIRKPKALGCGNPANNWVKHRFVLDKDNNPVELKPYQRFIPATLQDNPDKAFREIYDENLSKLSNYDQARLRFGDWQAIDDGGNKFYWNFKRNTHVIGAAGFDEERPVHISFDQNVVPYITATFWQVLQDGEGWKIRAFDELCLEHPKSNTVSLCEAIVEYYGDKMREMFYYGDASGNQRDTRNKPGESETDYSIVRNKLRKWLNNRSDRTERKNPPVLPRRDFINEIFAGRMPGIKIEVSDKCLRLIEDLTTVNQDANGHKLKKKVIDPVTRVSYEAVGHTSDTMDYIITAVFGPQFTKYRGR